MDNLLPHFTDIVLQNNESYQRIANQLALCIQLLNIERHKNKVIRRQNLSLNQRIYFQSLPSRSVNNVSQETVGSEEQELLLPTKQISSKERMVMNISNTEDDGNTDNDLK